MKYCCQAGLPVAVFLLLTTSWQIAGAFPAQNGLDQAAMQAELVRLADVCDSLGLVEESTISRTWLPQKRIDQQTLYLPVNLYASAEEDSKQALWTQHFNGARQRFAATLFAHARELAQNGNEAEAYQVLWHVLREDPTHAEAKRILGTLVSAVTVKPRLRKGIGPQADFHWPPGSYSRIQTPHFVVTSRADPHQSIDLAIRMEAFFAVWRQIFYPLWARPGALTARFNGSNTPWEKPPLMEVFLLQDRQDYLQVLGASESNLSVSVGYYAPHAKKSFFYPDQNLTATLYHELTHQLLAEASNIQVRPEAGDTGGIWLLEGIALYMESLDDCGSYWTVGGIESPRLQTARYRSVRDGYWMDWHQFTTGTKEQWKQSSSIAQFYSQAAGLTHLFMDQPQLPTGRSELMKCLVSVYQNEPDASQLLELLGGNDLSAQEAYQRGMIVTDDHILNLSRDGQQAGKPTAGRALKSLVLAGSQLKQETWQRLANFHDLQWLDLSFSNATSADLLWLSNLGTLQRLSLEGTRVDGQITEKLAQLNHLQELDLSGCSIDDRALMSLRGNATLESVWLTKTQVTDAALEVLGSLPQLKYCDPGETGISPAAWQTFVEQRPHLK